MNWETVQEKPKKNNFSLKSITKQQWAILILAGLILAVIAIPTSNTQESAESVFSAGASAEDTADSAGNLFAAQLEAMLGQVEGVGEVKVMLYTQDGGQYSVYGDSQGEICGVLIVAEGADNPLTVKNIQDAVMSLFQVDAHKIKVMKMK